MKSTRQITHDTMLTEEHRCYKKTQELEPFTTTIGEITIGDIGDKN